MSRYLADLIATHGYWLVATVVGLESMGLPLPGETMLVTAAIYAGATHHLHIGLVIGWTIVGAITGDNLGFLIGRRFGHPLLIRYGHFVRMNGARIRLGEFLFERHGGKVVFFGRFITLLRALAALLAGVNRMPWRRFLACNAAGAIVWAAGYGLAAYGFGTAIEQFTRPIAAVFLILAVAATLVFIGYVRRHEAALEAEAERRRPGALR